MSGKSESWAGIAQAMKLTGRSASVLYLAALEGRVRVRRQDGKIVYLVSDLSRLKGEDRLPLVTA